MCFFFFFNDTATTEIYTLSLHDALPISGRSRRCTGPRGGAPPLPRGRALGRDAARRPGPRDRRRGRAWRLGGAGGGSARGGRGTRGSCGAPGGRASRSRDGASLPFELGVPHTAKDRDALCPGRMRREGVGEQALVRGEPPGERVGNAEMRRPALDVRGGRVRALDLLQRARERERVAG